jgi:hypothetical protein
MAFGRFTDGSADSITFGIITLPWTFWVTLELLEHGGGGEGG